ncbi:ABC transporter ATP-binding protein [Mesorhizobium loti]|nr:ABC transporter ATP-binding protein [Mesorhizobium loti]
MPNQTDDYTSSTAPAGNGATVRFKGVRKTYDGGHSFAVTGLDLDVHDGEFLTLLGPSGSGKTTTLMMLAGFEDPSVGQIFIGDAPITGVPSHRRGIGVVFQSYALFPHMTVAENLAFPLKVRRLGRAEITDRVNSALAMVELSGFGGRKPSQLSGGQQQRVAVARALVFQPKLVLMDEPLGALDKRLRDQMQFELKSLQKRLGITVVYVTHDQVEALSMSDRIAVFDKGAVQQLASPDLIYRRPATLFVAGFIGDSNRMGATVVSSASDRRVAVRLAGGRVINANAATPMTAGTRATVSVRPEAFVLQPTGQGMNATILEVMPLGDQTRVRISCPQISTDAMTIKVASHYDEMRPAAGDNVFVDIDESDAMVFAEILQ